jgi:hypothetical protein
MEDEASLRCRRTMRRTWDSKRKNKLSMWLWRGVLFCHLSPLT